MLLMRGIYVQIDFGKTAKDYGAWRPGFPDALFDRLAAFGAGAPGQKLLDLGTLEHRRECLRDVAHRRIRLAPRGEYPFALAREL